MNSGYPDGFGAEIISADLLFKMDQEVISKSQREHVTLYIWDNLNNFNVKALPPTKELKHPKLKFDIDTAEDKYNMEYLIKKGVSINSSAKKIIELYYNNTIIEND